MLTLIKLSSPGWEKQFTNESSLKSVLYSHLCIDCREGRKVYIGQEGFETEFDDPVNENSTIDEMLSTSCGCEYMVEEGLE
jgi:hypothetical protein